MGLHQDSLAKILKAAGVKDSFSLNYHDLKRLIQEGKIRSAYYHVKDMAEFRMVRWGPLHDTETGGDFNKLIEEGVLSLQEDSLGELLQTLNFYGGETVELEWREMYEDDEEYLKVLNDFKEKFNIDHKTQQPFLAQGMEVEDLVSFVEQWYEAQARPEKWNPSYAPLLKNVGIYEMIQGSPRKWLRNLDAEKWNSIEVCEEDWSDEGVHLGTIHRSIHYNMVTLPFDGWTLAECFRISYQKIIN